MQTKILIALFDTFKNIQLTRGKTCEVGSRVYCLCICLYGQGEFDRILWGRFCNSGIFIRLFLSGIIGTFLTDKYVLNNYQMGGG